MVGSSITLGFCLLIANISFAKDVSEVLYFGAACNLSALMTGLIVDKLDFTDLLALTLVFPLFFSVTFIVSHCCRKTVPCKEKGPCS